MLIVGQKITFQQNLAYQRQIIPIHTRFYGGAFQGGSGERLHGMQEVTVIRIGPVISTRKKSTAQECVVFFCTPSVLPLRGNPPSLRGRLFVVAVNFAA